MIGKIAICSQCGKHRYWLVRKLECNNTVQPAKTIGWIMFNSSTATATINDPTIKRVIGFSKREQATKAFVANVIPYRSPYPKDLNKLPIADAFGKERKQSKAMNDLINRSDMVICAWGALGHNTHRNPSFRHGLKILLDAINKSPSQPLFYCLGLTKKGHPRHPLPVCKTDPLKPFDLIQYLRDNNVR